MLKISNSLPKVEHYINTENNKRVRFDGFLGILKFESFYYTSTFVCLFVCHCLIILLGFLHAEPNFIDCITLSRNIWIINPGLISFSQDTGTNRATACQT